jgi:hypothetical protein
MQAPSHSLEPASHWQAEPTHSKPSPQSLLAQQAASHAGSTGVLGTPPVAGSSAPVEVFAGTGAVGPGLDDSVSDVVLGPLSGPVSEVSVGDVSVSGGPEGDGTVASARVCAVLDTGASGFPEPPCPPVPDPDVVADVIAEVPPEPPLPAASAESPANVARFPEHPSATNAAAATTLYFM